ncbi:ATP-binding protein [Saccharothrix sp. NRRL B-16348]|uniref:ATP-binding protein n=1 Tax=Saccharothrix sp. NRRL B-16348 TaxID=1415542 RepID=UPI0006B042E4|nr:XRE family transcriptional regulator [Saccharothrix sp. NRRL B-16348]
MHDDEAPPPAAEPVELSSLLRSFRTRALLTQEELAERAGLGVSSIRGAESGRIRRPRAASVRQLADALNLPAPDRDRLIQAALGAPGEPTTAGRSDRVDTAPAQLPPAAPGFVGRATALGALDALLPACDEPGGTIAAISGMAGVGKTALALHWAHRIADRFPDGQLYVNLRAFDPTGEPVPPAEALRDLLDALNVPPHRVPSTLNAQTGLYRSLLGNRRMLILLDNARDTEQVRRLLPGADGCLVIVTSRDRLTSLVAIEGAQPLPLDVLTVGEARELLALRIGTARAAADPEAVDEIIDRCGRLPLALAVVAARAGTQPGVPLPLLAKDMRQAGDVLDSLDEPGDPADLRTLFSWSYQDLDEDAARMFRLLGLHPGPEVSTAAAACLADVTRARGQTLLSRLTRVHLIFELTPGRYGLHNLLHAYAAELALAEESADRRRTATHRLLDHYVHTAYAAARRLSPHRPTSVPDPPPRPDGEDVDDPAAALAWFRAEFPVLRGLADQTAAAGLPLHTWQLAWGLRDFLHRQGHWHHMVSIHRSALNAARELQDRALAAYALRNLGTASTRLGRFEEAEDHHAEALSLSTALADHVGMANAELCLIELAEARRQYDIALVHARRALRHYRAAGDKPGEAHALNGLAWASLHLGHYDAAIRYGRQALTVWETTRNPLGAAHVIANLGHAHRGLGKLPEAITFLQRALPLSVEVGDRYLEAEVLTAIGDVHHAADDPDQARQAWDRAREILRMLGHAKVEELRARLGDDR